MCASVLSPVPGQGITPEMVEVFPFETQAYFNCWWEQLSPKFKIKARHNNLLTLQRSFFKGLLPLTELRVAGWHNAWCHDLTPERLADFLSFASDTSWDVFKLTWLEERKAHQSFEQLEAAGYRLIQTPGQPQYIIDMSQGYDAYMAAKSSNNRHQVRRKFKRAKSLNPQLVEITTLEEFDSFMARFFELHFAYWGEKAGGSYFQDPHERAFILAWLRGLLASGQAIIQEFRLNGEAANLSVYLRFGDTLYYLLTMNTGTYQEYAPGILALYSRLEKSANEGIAKVNMGAGDYEYKVLASSYAAPTYTVSAINPHSLTGRLYSVYLRRKTGQPS